MMRLSSSKWKNDRAATIGQCGPKEVVSSTARIVAVPTPRLGTEAEVCADWAGKMEAQGIIALS